MKKIFLAILLSFLIIFSGGTMAFAIEYIDGGINKDSTAPLLTDTFTYINTYDGVVGTPMYFRLIPTMNDTYTIQTIGTVDTEGELYDKNGESIDVQDDVVGTNFLINRELIAGETYYLRVTNYSGIPGDQTTLQITAEGGGGLSGAEAAPTATVQAITGTLQVGEMLTGHYTYSDVNGDIEGTSTYKWYRADNSSGLNKTVITGETAKTYVLQSADAGKYISFEVTPVATTGTAQGTAVESEKVGAIVGDTTAPAGYSIFIDQVAINNGNKTDMSFTFSGAEAGATYNYTVSSSGGGTPITGTGTVSSASQQITGIDITELPDGTLTLEVTLTDTDGNEGEEATDTVSKDTTAPAGYSIIIDQAAINNGNKTDMSFTFSGAEVGASYEYMVLSNGGGTPITGTGTISSASQQITGINTTSLSDGTLTLEVTLTDAAGNTGATATDTVSKDATTPAGYSIFIDQVGIDNGNKTDMSFTFSGAEAGATYDYVVSSNGGGTPITGTGTVSSASQQITGIDITELPDGTLTLSITLTDAAGNTGATATDTVSKDTIFEVAPMATVQAITGTLKVGETLTGHYIYSDVNGDLEGTSTYKWYSSDDASGLNKAVIVGATSLTYVLQAADTGKYISFEVTPVAATGIAQGTAVGSANAGAVVPAEAAPTAIVQAITGILKVGETLTGHYTYSDVNGDLEGTSTYKWYSSDDASGLNKTAIAGATFITYVLQAADTGEYISFEVTPVAATGIAQGTAVESAKIGSVTPASSSGSGGGSSSTTTTQSSQNKVVVVNGKEYNTGKETLKTEDGKSMVTVELDNRDIESKIDEAIKINTTGIDNVIQIRISDRKSEVAKVELTGDIVKKLEESAFNVSVKRDNIEYVIPAEEFIISEVAENLGVLEKDLEDIKIEVKITKLDGAVLAKYNEVVKDNGAELVFPPVSFEVVAKTVKTDDTTEKVEISKFSNYVERIMEIPTSINPSKITTGIVFNPDGTYSHVPTEVYQKDGKRYARLNSITNSEYSVIWNPVNVESVENHWSKDAVNDMASRLVIFNTETFAPDKSITRADFAEYIVRALGIYREGLKYENKFSDVSANGARTLAIHIANEYGIVEGYTDGAFRPDALITREEAMTMYQRAMKITKLVGTDSYRYQSYKDYKQVSSWATSYVKEVLSAHVFDGNTATTISPKSNLTYAEAAQAIKNLLVESKFINK